MNEQQSHLAQTTKQQLYIAAQGVPRGLQLKSSGWYVSPFV